MWHDFSVPLLLWMLFSERITDLVLQTHTAVIGIDVPIFSALSLKMVSRFRTKLELSNVLPEKADW